jgi:hypothetical protein
MGLSFGLRCRKDSVMPAAIPKRPADNDHDDVVRGDVCSRRGERHVIGFALE